MEVRKANMSDLEKILEIYAGAREFMRNNGNPSQWGGSYPEVETVKEDIDGGNLQLICENGEILGVFAFFEEGDKDYLHINGAWLNSLPFAAIHRVASAGKKGGIMAECVKYCLEFTDNLKIDTHEDNFPMQRSLERLGFVRCGKVNIPGAGERIAYQLYKDF